MTKEHPLRKRYLELNEGIDPESLTQVFISVKRVADNYFIEMGEDNCILSLSIDVRYSDSVSCSHHAPLGERTNWSGDKSRPSNFPGFAGRITVRYKNRPHTFGSVPLKPSLTHTGTGGWGSFERGDQELCKAWSELHSRRLRNKIFPWPEPVFYSWDYRFFLQDFPAFQKRFEKMQVINILQDETLSENDLRSNAYWQDPETGRADHRMRSAAGKL